MAKSARMLSSGELAAFCAQLSLILKSGITTADGLSVMVDDAATDEGRQILTALRDSSERGETLSRSLAQSAVYPRYMVDMVEIGEASGRLDQVMDSLCSYYEREEALSRSIRNAVTYPLIMVAMMLVVISVLVIKVLPMFRQVFEQLGGGSGSFSSGILRFGNGIGVTALVLVGLIAVGFATFAVMRTTAGGRAALSRFQNKFFVTKKISSKISSGRIASALALTFASGVDPDRALEMSARVADDPVVSAKLQSAQEAVASGSSFSDALAQSGIFTGVYSRMVAVGFKTGAADQVMNKLAVRYEEEVDNSLGDLISVLEPTLVAVLSIIVGMILLSVMLPLMGIMSSIG